MSRRWAKLPIGWTWYWRGAGCFCTDGLVSAGTAAVDYGLDRLCGAVTVEPADSVCHP